MIDTLKTLCALNGVSGNEDEVREYIAARVKKTADEVVVDNMGNVIAVKRGRRTASKKIMLCAHMDEVGVVCTSITDEGFLRFAMSGSVDNRVVVGKKVELGRNRVPGIIGCKALHLLKGKDAEKAVDVDDMYIDIGAGNREEAEKLIATGDTGAFDGAIVEFGDGYIKAKAIDDRFGCAVLISLIESDTPIDCTFTFSVQEEVGLRGATTAAFRAAPDIALIVEGTTAADIPSTPESKKVCKLGGGAVIPFMDGGTIYDKELVAFLNALADDSGIPRQTKNVIAGSTDGAAVQRSRAGVKTAGIAAPVRNLHSPSCVARISDLEAVRKLAGLFLEEVGERF